eukprot:XP_027320374.1 uncharacterized protein LOC106019821 [Anas platyrhynchos]
MRLSSTQAILCLSQGGNAVVLAARDTETAGACPRTHGASQKPQCLNLVGQGGRRPSRLSQVRMEALAWLSWLWWPQQCVCELLTAASPGRVSVSLGLRECFSAPEGSLQTKWGVFCFVFVFVFTWADSDRRGNKHKGLFGSLYTVGGTSPRRAARRCPGELWLPHPWQCPRPGWMGLGAAPGALPRCPSRASRRRPARLRPGPSGAAAAASSLRSARGRRRAAGGRKRPRSAAAAAAAGCSPRSAAGRGTGARDGAAAAQQHRGPGGAGAGPRLCLQPPEEPEPQPGAWAAPGAGAGAGAGPAGHGRFAEEAPGRGPGTEAGGSGAGRGGAGAGFRGGLGGGRAGAGPRPPRLPAGPGPAARGSQRRGLFWEPPPQGRGRAGPPRRPLTQRDLYLQ